jgi:hypothetical protein
MVSPGEAPKKRAKKVLARLGGERQPRGRTRRATRERGSAAPPRLLHGARDATRDREPQARGASN